MSRSRIVCSEILYGNSNSNNYNGNGNNQNEEIFMKNVDVNNVLSDTNASSLMEDWPESSDCIVNVYLNDDLPKEPDTVPFDLEKRCFESSKSLWDRRNDCNVENQPDLNDGVLPFPYGNLELFDTDTGKYLDILHDSSPLSTIDTMIGCTTIVTNTVVKCRSKTKIVIKTDEGDENFEGNTKELMELTSTNRKGPRPNKPVEGEHIIMSVKTAAEIKKEQQRNGTTFQQEPEDKLRCKMLGILGITDDVLHNIRTSLGLSIWICPQQGCRRVFNRLNTLKSHILNHCNIKPYKCDYPNCPWSFYTSFKLKRHRETHLKRKDFVCNAPNCNRPFSTIYNLNTHLKMHERPALLSCLVRNCDQKFQTQRAMDMHLKTHEVSLAPYKCTHAGCDKMYYSGSALIAHTRCHQHSEEELRCQWENCGRWFDKPCRLKAHMRQHTGDRPYACTFHGCKWAFSSASKLTRHQSRHIKERKFHCTTNGCDKAFVRPEHLRCHTLTHSAQKKFQCPICGEKCADKTTLYVHKKKFHPNECEKSENNMMNDNDTLLLTLNDDSDNSFTINDDYNNEANSERTDLEVIKESSGFISLFQSSDEQPEIDLLEFSMSNNAETVALTDEMETVNFYVNEGCDEYNILILDSDINSNLPESTNNSEDIN